jgi:hypothetical protein
VSSPQDQSPSGDSARSASLESSAAQAWGQEQARQARSRQVPSGQPSGQASVGQPSGQVSGQVSVGKVMADGRTVFRSSGPVILFWGWVAIAVFALGDLAVQGHNRGAVVPALTVVLITGLMYACALRPRVEADSDGITVQNPLRDYRLPWGAIKAIYLGDSVEVQCARRPPKDKGTVYCWALYSSRRSRAKSSYRTESRSRSRRRAAGYSRMPAEAQAALSKGTAEIIAAEVGRMLKEAQARGHAGGFVTGRWAWQSIAAIVIPAVALTLAVVL